MALFKGSKYLSRLLSIASVFALVAACKPAPVSHWFPVTPREHYEKELYQSKLEKTAGGQTWFRLAESVLNDSITVTAPHQERLFLADSVSAQAILVKIPQGRKLVIQTNRDDQDTLSHVFAELYQISQNGKPRRLDYMRENSSTMEFSNFEQDTLLLRLQNGLGEKTAVTVSFSTRPTLYFPVSGHGMSNVISFWGAERDAGARSHEGIDIRAKRGTPVVASRNGFITQAGTNNLGGKVVFLTSLDDPYSIYYAHLDSQFVSAGTRVKLGDTLGTVGNTGNAITTSPHLHFGIYARSSGAVNPLPFIDDREEKMPALPERSLLLGDTVTIRKKTTLFDGPDFRTSRKIGTLPTESDVRIIGEISRGYRVQLKDGSKGYIPTVPVRKRSGLVTADIR